MKKPKSSVVSSDSNASWDLTPDEIAQLNKEIAQERDDDSMFREFVIEEMKQKQSVARGMGYKDFQGKLDYMDAQIRELQTESIATFNHNLSMI